jgi:uncharacterized membrane protein
VALPSILCGLALVAVGLVAYFPDRPSITALIPAFVGLALVLLGVIALKEGLRKHAMHLAAMIGLLGFIASAVQFLRGLFKNDFQMPASGIYLILMGLLCGLFFALCLNSFLVARRRRMAGGDNER